MNINEIRSKLSEVRSLGFVKTLRKGSTGVGHTLEYLLGKKEDNISSPDFGAIELKAQRENHSGLTTLFTFNKKVWQIDPLDAIKKYGSLDKNDRQGMYYTMGMRPNSAGLFLHVEDDCISVRHIDGTVIAIWQLSEVRKRFEAKVKNVLLVKAQVEIRDGIEYFYYDRAKLLSGGTSKSILKNQFENEKLLVDLRLHDKGTMARNHGTGFRVYEKHLGDLYTTVEEFAL